MDFFFLACILCVLLMASSFALCVVVGVCLAVTVGDVWLQMDFHFYLAASVDGGGRLQCCAPNIFNFFLFWVENAL